MRGTSKIVIIIIASALILGGVIIYISGAFSPNKSATKVGQETPVKEKNMRLTSPAFQNNELIPTKYACDGNDISPPLEISDVSDNAKSLALIVDDPDALGGTWVHWTVFNIDPQTVQISENSVPDKAIQGMTSFGRSGYGGPCPPSGTHHYYFKLYALDKELDLDSSAKKQDIENAIQSHVIQQTELIGQYRK
jgi:hypothetical protein